MTSTVNNTERVVCDECWLSFEPINGRKSKLCTSCAPYDNALSCNDNIDTKIINAEDDNTITKDVDKPCPDRGLTLIRDVSVSKKLSHFIFS